MQAIHPGPSPSPPSPPLTLRWVPSRALPLHGGYPPAHHSHSDGSHPGPSPSVGDAESLVQIEVRDITAVVSRPAQPHLCIQVGSIHVHLTKEREASTVRKTWEILKRERNLGRREVVTHQPPAFVDHVTDVLDGVLEDSTGGWVGDHDGCQVIAVLFDLRTGVGRRWFRVATSFKLNSTTLATLVRVQ